jgi:hypothetical protein
MLIQYLAEYLEREFIINLMLKMSKLSLVKPPAITVNSSRNQYIECES